MALIYPTIWEQGEQRERITPGYHYKKELKSLVIPAHQVVTIYENEDRQGKKSMPLYGGTYHHLSFYDITERPGLIHVEDCGLTDLDLVEIGWWSTYDEAASKRTNGKEGRYPMYYSLPTGDHKGGDSFPDNHIQWIYLPFGMTVEVFNQGDFQGGSLIFSGNTQGEKERFNLWDHRFSDGGDSASWKTSSMRVRADKWEPAGIELRNVVVQADDHSKFGGTTTIHNNSPHKGMASKEVSWEKGNAITTEDNWDIGGRVCAKAGFEAETGFMGQKVTVTGELEVEVSGGYGQAKTKSNNDSKTITDIVQVELEGWGSAKVSTIIEYGKMTAKAIRKWRNTRNNVIIEEEGNISFSWANDAQHEINGTSTPPMERNED